MTSEPNLDKAPANVQRLLKECLRKDPETRLRWIGDVGRFLDDPRPAPPVAQSSEPRTQPRKFIWSAIAALFAVAAALFTWLWLRPTPREPAPVIRIATALPVGQQPGPLAISRDGSRIAFVSGPSSQIYVRAMDQLDARPLAGTEVASFLCFSPDAQEIVFLQNGGSQSQSPQLKKVSLAGGTVQTLVGVSVMNGPPVPDWGDDGSIIFTDNTGLSQIQSTGGSPTVLLKPDLKNTEVFFSNAQWLPGGREILLTVNRGPIGTQVFAFNPQTRAKSSLRSTRLTT